MLIVKRYKNVAMMFLYPFLLFIGLFIFFYFFQNKIAGYSVVFGGLTYCLPVLLANLFLGSSKVNSTNSAMAIVAKAYLGSFYKIALSIALLIYFFKFVNIEFPIFMLGYVVALVMQYVMSFVLLNATRQDI